jgi:hypothetical protein
MRNILQWRGDEATGRNGNDHFMAYVRNVQDTINKDVLLWQPVEEERKAAQHS